MKAKPIDLRSDTVTLPPEAMLAAMIKAPLGDDVYGEDPTINALEQRLAQMTGKDAALFVASGTMGNLVASLSHCGRGDEIILGDRSHIARWEQGGASTLGGISLRTSFHRPSASSDRSGTREPSTYSASPSTSAYSVLTNGVPCIASAASNCARLVARAI
ncbi:MAG TPA: beta-eliminating lyase-related protein, partial [Candidatus Obscuribacter sp.]|nr:beta-eliminating lyase-related protein [Candidatus Obscuribacter sp.]